MAKQQIQDLMVIEPALLRVLADPVRSFIVYSLVGEAKTTKELAGELGCPPTRLYYHLQQLEKHGLVFVERTRLVSGIREKHYRAAARDLRLERGGMVAGDGGDAAGERERREALLGFVFDQSRVEIARGLQDGRIDPARKAPEVGALMAYRNVLKLSPEQAARLYQQLHAFWQEYDVIAKEPAADGSFYAFAVALYPNDLSADSASASASAKRPRKAVAGEGGGR